MPELALSQQTLLIVLSVPSEVASPKKSSRSKTALLLHKVFSFTFVPSLLLRSLSAIQLAIQLQKASTCAAYLVNKQP